MPARQPLPSLHLDGLPTSTPPKLGASSRRTRSPVPCRVCTHRESSCHCRPHFHHHQRRRHPSASTPPNRLAAPATADRCEGEDWEQPANTGLLGPIGGSFRSQYWKHRANIRLAYLPTHLWVSATGYACVYCIRRPRRVSLGKSTLNIVTGPARVGLAAADGDVR